MIEAGLARLRWVGFLGAALLCTLTAAEAGAAAPGALSEKVVDARSAIAYWTPERMREARELSPRPAPFEGTALAPPGSVAPQGPPVAIPGRPGPGSRSVPPDEETNPALDTVYPQRIHGKVFGTTPGFGNFACSGTIGPSPLRNLLATAGHCVFAFGQTNGFATNVVFVPGYRNGSAPLGVWPATSLFTLAGWANGGGFASDIGMGHLGTVNGQQIETSLGSRGIAFNQDPDQEFDHFGYPARPNVAHPEDGFGDYDGERLILCDDASSQAIEDLGDGPSIGSAYCNMQQGSSGGGWIIDLDSDYINSVVSHGYCHLDPPGLKTPWDPATGTGRCGIFFGPYFGDGAAALYELATTPPQADPAPKKKKKKCKKKRKRKCKKKKGKKKAG